VIYQVLQFGHSETYYKDDGVWGIAVEGLPDGGAIITREAWKALIGLPFRYFRSGEDEDTAMPPVPIHEREHFLRVFTRTESFGLPQGRGWAAEPDWLIRLLEHMKFIRDHVEAWIARGRK